MKLKPMHIGGEVCGYQFRCPGCGHSHAFFLRHHAGQEHLQTWQFNGNLELPTFTPSLGNRTPDRYCHLQLTNGVIHYYPDSTHALSGQAVPMLEFDTD